MTTYTREQIERAYARAKADTRFRFGVHKSGPTLTLEAKRFITEMYERMSGEKVFEEEVEA